MGAVVTVAELIARLSAFPLDTLVLVDGYEFGYDDVREPYALRVRSVDRDGYWAGAYEEAEEREQDAASAVVLPR